MFDMILSVIRTHTYRDSNALIEKMQRLYLEGILTEEQYLTLRTALAEAQPVKTYDYEAEFDRLWVEVKRIAAIVDTMPEPTPTPEPDIADWVQPTGAHDAYNTGDKVRFKGDIYESLIDGNVWSPEVYPQGWQRLLEETEA